MTKNLNKLVADLQKRVERLESEIFSTLPKKRPPKDKVVETFRGPTGGIRLLIKEGYFETRRNRSVVHETLGKKGRRHPHLE